MYFFPSAPCLEERSVYYLKWFAQIIQKSFFKELLDMNKWAFQTGCYIRSHWVKAMFNNYLHKNWWKTFVKLWWGAGGWGRQRGGGGWSLLLAVLAVRAGHWRMGNNEGQSKCWPSSLLCTWEIHLGFISHINHFSAERSHKSPQKDWNGIISLGIIS